MTNEVIALQNEAIVIFDKVKSSIGNTTNDQNLNCNMVHTTLKDKSSSFWYFDSECSGHMTGDKSFFTKLTITNHGSITFGDGNKALICGKGSINALGIPKLNDVLYVERFKANLINVSQICDSRCTVEFTQKDCTVYDDLENTLVRCIIL